MAIEGKHMTWSTKAGADLSDLTAGTGALYKAITQLGVKAASPGDDAKGLLLYGGTSGSHVTLGVMGEMKFTAGAAVTSVNAPLSVAAAGFLTVATSGDFVVGHFTQGTNRSTSISSGSVGTGLFDFVNPQYAASAAALTF